MFPKRFQILAPYIASWIFPEIPRPPATEIFRWLSQPNKEQRAAKKIKTCESLDSEKRITFNGLDRFFYYPQDGSWPDFCQTVDECLNPNRSV